MSTADAQAARAPQRARMVFLVIAIVLSVVVIVSTGLEWGSLTVRHILVVAEPGTGEWQGVAALVAATAGVLWVGLAATRGRMALAALGALVAGLAISVVALLEVVHLVTRPAQIADVVRAGAASIPLKGYRVPPIESSVGPGTWIALAAGAALALVGLVALVVPAWRARR